MTTDQAVVMIFDAMRKIYGIPTIEKKWPAGELQAVKAVWQKQLSGFTPKTLMAASQAMIDSCEYPPSLPEFKALCRQFNRPEHQSIPALPMPTVSPEQARANIAAVRAALKTVVKEMPK